VQGSNVTKAMDTREGSGGLFSASIRTDHVKYSVGPLPEGFEPMRLMSTVVLLCLDDVMRCSSHEQM
jgi:hypothetical protein